MSDYIMWTIVACVLFATAIFFALPSVFTGNMMPIEIVATCAVDGKLYFEKDDVTVTCEVVRK